MQIFLSYRRDDAAAWAGRLRDALAARFGDDSIFQDVVAIRPGRNFADAIEAAIMRSDVAIAVIGPGWLTASGPDGEQRLEQADDYVRSELLAAFAHTTLVIPVLVGGAAMPSSAQLPEVLRPLGLLQAVTLHNATWHQDVEGLIRALTGKTTTLRRRWQVAVSVVVGVLIVGGIAWLLVDQRDRDGSLTNGETSSTTSGSSETQPGRVDVTVRCETPQGPEWTELGVTGEAQLADGMNFEVIDGYSRMEESGPWLVVLRTEVTNTTPAWSQTHSSWFYRLVVEGTDHMPSCFGVIAGENPIGPGASSEALVGFEIPIDPERPLALDLDTAGVFGRIDLTPSEGTG